MKSHFLAIGFGAALTLTVVAAHAEQPTHGACAVVKAEDLKALMGKEPTGIGKRGTCTWSVDGSPAKLMTTKFPDTGMAAEMAYADMQKNAEKGGKSGDVISMKDLGDRGFARLNQKGLVLVTIKNGTLLQMLYLTGTPGTQQDVDALRNIAEKIIKGF